MKRNSTFAGRFALTGVAAAALCLLAPSAWSLGLGRLQVQSALGEALRAEIDVTSLTPDEAANLRVRVATPEAYRTAGVDYNAVLPGTTAQLLRRDDGRPYLRLTSDRSVQEPFVDVILELNWSTGRLVREYTLLFDPPSTPRASVPSPVTSTAISPAPFPAPVPLPAPATSPSTAALPSPALAPRPSERRPVAPRPSEAVAMPAPSPTPRPAAAGPDDYKVRAGDSLSRIASATQRPGVSLDQMLVSLYRANPDAFMDSNMNRLKSGVVLSVPSAEAANAIGPAEARQVIQAQSADFGAYRQRLASGVPAATEGSARQSSGKVQVEDRKQAAAPTPDKLTLSKGAAAAASTSAEAQISRDRAKQADDRRVAELAKNVDELKRLSGATATAGAASKPAAATPTPTPVPAPTARPASAPSPAPAPVVAAAPAPVPAPAPAPAPVTIPVPVPVPAPAPAPVSPPPPPPAPAPALAPLSIPTPASVAAGPTPAPASAPVVAPSSSTATALAPAKPASTPAKPKAPAPASEPGVLGSLLDDNPMALGLGGLAILLLGGFGLYRLSKRGKHDSSETSFLESRLQPDSFFGASGGQRVDTRDAGGTSSSMSYSLSQLDAIGDVDPVAEADVYLAYGRDLQAEEILKEAMRSTPERMAIRTKLLEVYAKRRDTKGFELLATQLFALTRGEGEDWARAQELGIDIDPDNVLYQPGGKPAMAAADGGGVVEPLGASTMPYSISPSQQFGSTSILPPEVDSRSMGLDLDLDLDDAETGSPTSPSPLDTRPPEPEFEPQPEPMDDFNDHDDSMSLDFTVPEVPELQTTAVPQMPEPSSFDLSSISLDLDLPETPASTTPTPLSAAPSGFGDIDMPPLDVNDGGDPMARKLELAEEFRQIGDTDGARDLLQEVIAKSSGAVRSRAQSMLADLG